MAATGTFWTSCLSLYLIFVSNIYCQIIDTKNNCITKSESDNVKAIQENVEELSTKLRKQAFELEKMKSSLKGKRLYIAKNAAIFLTLLPVLRFFLHLHVT